MNKIIINVGRQIGSGGHIIAEKLAEDFGCKCYDRELLNLAAKESGFSEKFFEQNDEQKGFFKSLFHTHLPFLSDNNFYHNDFSQEGLYKFQSDAIRKAADEGNCVFVGRTADYVLRDYKNVINIFITANIDDRIKAVCKRKDIDRDASGSACRHRGRRVHRGRVRHVRRTEPRMDHRQSLRPQVHRKPRGAARLLLRLLYRQEVGTQRELRPLHQQQPSGNRRNREVYRRIYQKEVRT